VHILANLLGRCVGLLLALLLWNLLALLLGHILAIGVGNLGSYLLLCQGYGWKLQKGNTLVGF